MNPNLPHLHLILNHVPTVGTVIALSVCWPPASCGRATPSPR